LIFLHILLVLVIALLLVTAHVRINCLVVRWFVGVIGW
jgi:uncharacterized MnhB-related membrane protein